MMSDDPDLIGKVMYLGAAVEIGTTQIWAGQLNVLGAAKPTTLPQVQYGTGMIRSHCIIILTIDIP